MPYNEFNLLKGNHDLKFDVDLLENNGDLIKHFTIQSFDFYQINDEKSLDKKNDIAKFDKVWVDYNVYNDDGVLGMRIHTKFTVYNMKDIDCRLAIGFMNGEVNLKSNKTEYSSKNGQLAIYKNLKPAYDSAVYKDYNIFMPYREFNLPKGNYNLKMHIDLLYGNDNKDFHLTYYEFDFIQN